jgi:hypothetical protein
MLFHTTHVEHIDAAVEWPNQPYVPPTVKKKGAPLKDLKESVRIIKPFINFMAFFSYPQEPYLRPPCPSNARKHRLEGWQVH